MLSFDFILLFVGTLRKIFLVFIYSSSSIISSIVVLYLDPLTFDLPTNKFRLAGVFHFKAKMLIIKKSLLQPRVTSVLLRVIVGWQCGLNKCLSSKY